VDEVFSQERPTASHCVVGGEGIVLPPREVGLVALGLR
jgi:hypothetical protein